MKRRDFLASSLAAGTLPVTAAIAATSDNEEREYLEIIKYEMHIGAKKKMLSDFYKDVAIPAYNRLGVGPIGVLSPRYGENNLSLYIFVPHKTIESVTATQERLLDDQNYLKEGASLLNAPFSDAAYDRFERSLLIAFSKMPRLEAHSDLLDNRSRIYEMRIYESHSRKYGRKKIEMFNQGGEIEIFRKAGLRPVFFAETMFGLRMPNLIYMLVFENMASRDKNWTVFSDHPDWLKLRQDPQYKDTVSCITDIILSPASFSQI